MFEKTKWSTIAGTLKGEGMEYTAKVLEAKYEWLQDIGRINANGVYIPPFASTPPPTSDAAEADGDDEADVEAED